MPEFDLSQSNVEEIAARHPLAVLADLTNADKHRTLALGTLVGAPTAPLGAVRSTDCEIRDVREAIPDEVRDGVEFATFDVAQTGPNPVVHVHLNTTMMGLVGGQGFVRRHPWMEEAVIRVVEEFVPVFETR